MKRRAVFCGIALVLVAETTRAEAAPGESPAVDAAAPGWYRATLDYGAHGQLPFFLSLPGKDALGKASAVNGEQVVEFDHEWKGTAVAIKPRLSTESRIDAKLAANGELTGHWTRYTPIWGKIVVPFHAVPISAPDPEKRFSPEALDRAGGTADKPVDVGGVWRIKWAARGDGIARFNQAPSGVVTGYYQAKHYGDSQPLAGNIRGRRLMLSSFNGTNSTTLVNIEIDPDGKHLAGETHVSNFWHEKFTGERDDPYVLANEVRLKKGDKIKLPALEKAPYKGKPVILVCFATWCASCMDETRYLVSLYRRLHPEGLEILGQTYDLSANKQENAKALARFRDIMGVSWDVTTVQGRPDQFGSLQPFPQIDGFEAVPLTVFIGRDGKVRKMHGGFSGPATGKEYEALTAEFTKAAEEIVASKP
jgi:thiol-disulfide isomerase/thioredoxin